ncbi:MAG: ABC transporter ATP-binding protein/permease [Coprobacillus sp.]|nr:ABC transporter ATP-binding protein/permease [Coprobacillus sp.]
MPGPMGGAGARRGGPMGGRGNTGEKANDFWGTWKRIILYSKKLLPVMGIALICAIGAAVCALLGPGYLSDISDEIQLGIQGNIAVNMDEVVHLCIILLIIYVVSALLHFTTSLTMAWVTISIAQKMRTDISNKINVLPMKYFNLHETGDIMSRVTNDVDMVAQSLNSVVSTLFTAVTNFIGALIMMFVTNWILAFTGIAASIIGFAFMLIIMSRSQKYFLQQQRYLGDVDGHIEEVYTGHTIVKAYNGEEEEKIKFDDLNNHLRSANFRANSLSGLMMPFMTFVGNLAYVAVCVVGAILVKNDTITIGVIIAFIVYVRVFTSPLSQIAQATQSMQSAAAAGERVFQFFDETPLPDESYKPSFNTLKAQALGENAPVDENGNYLPIPTKGDVVFDHVQFGYEDTGVIVIHDLCAHAKAGKKIAIVGPTGAGKTTIVNCLMRFHELVSGDIRIDGVSTKDISMSDVRSNFCMVLQDTWLFEGTIKENLVYNLEGISDETVLEACEAVGLTYLINTLPEGLDTVINDDINLSAGQKQQLTIARAIIANRPILILDEATSSIDTRTEIKIQEAMDKLMEGRTSFVIAHRLSTIKNADLILVLDHGDVVEQGTHEELLAKGGFYSNLYNSQFDPE